MRTKKEIEEQLEVIEKKIGKAHRKTLADKGMGTLPPVTHAEKVAYLDGLATAYDWVLENQ